MSTIETTGEIWQVDDATYFADKTSTSNTMLGWFISSPELYHGIVSGRFPAPTFTAAPLGKVVHSCILEGQSLDEVCVPMPEGMIRRGKAWDEFRSEHCSREILSADEHAAALAMLKGICADALAMQILRMNGPTEQAIRWTCKVSGLKRRAKIDKQAGQFILDLKTTSDISPKCFAASCWKYGYARQAAFYQDAAESLTGERPSVVFLAVEKEAPFRCQCYDLDAEFLTMGRDVMERKLEELAGCIETGNWSSPSAGKVLTLSAPAWAKYEGDWE